MHHLISLTEFTLWMHAYRFPKMVGRISGALQERTKHSDNHAIIFKKDDPDYLMIGTDGGIYESFDLAQTWRFISNLPITQYYKVAVDDREPFYHIYGGTQDNGSHGGPSRTDNSHGIRNADWYKTLGADGHQSATEPGNPNIMYAETQQGGLHRVDRITGEQVYIQPQAGADDDPERFNWDAPILVSPHSPSRLYFASQRVWRSDNRGDSWTAISSDLTRDQERIALPIMGKVQSWDNPWDVNAMSNYNTITSLAESPKLDGLIYAGTDDGIVQVTEDGGKNWRKIEAGSMPGVPSTAFVNDIKADLFDMNTVYIALDNHKYGDFKPYLLKSTDRGKSWKSISANIPDRHLVWRMVQDHVSPNLLFAATEFGIFFTLDGGEKWIKLKGGAPTISFRDLAIQRRENDLIGASFGRGFFVLDDYSVLREMSEEKLKKEGSLFATRKARWYVPRNVVSSQGDEHFTADNPPFGAVFTYHLAEGFTSLTAERKKKEKELAKEGKDIPFPGWDALDEEKQEEKAQIWLSVKDSEGNLVRKISAPAKKGLYRVAWDLRYASQNPIRLRQSAAGGGFRGGGSGFPVTPGTYSVTLSKQVDGVITELDGPVNFEVVPLRKGAMEGASYEEIAGFRQKMEELQTSISAASYMMSQSRSKISAMETAIERSRGETGTIASQLHQLKQDMLALNEEMYGSEAKGEIGELTPSSIRSRMFMGYRGLSTTYGPTDMHKESIKIAQGQLEAFMPKIEKIYKERIPELEEALMQAGAPLIEGQPCRSDNI